MFVCACLGWGPMSQHYVTRGQNQFWPSATWVPGIELGSWGWVAGVFNHWTISSALACFLNRSGAWEGSAREVVLFFNAYDIKTPHYHSRPLTQSDPKFKCVHWRRWMSCLYAAAVTVHCFLRQGGHVKIDVILARGEPGDFSIHRCRREAPACTAPRWTRCLIGLLADSPPQPVKKCWKWLGR